jgi:aminoglycoside/choline kinase family phosphotransferase
MHSPLADPRAAAIRHWLSATLATEAFALAPASADASFRRYFRVTLDAPAQRRDLPATLIAMDAPPAQENCAPFVMVAALLEAADVHAPRVFAQDLAAGFLLLSDLGHDTYLDRLDADNANVLYGDAIDALVRMQTRIDAHALPPYDQALLRRELDLFPDWYVARHRQRSLTKAQRTTLEEAFAALLANNLAQPRVFVHRDYHSRNLMVASPNPGVLDFQDAVHGPVTYDLVSLLRDAYIAWDDERQTAWARRYFERAHAGGLPIAPDFPSFWRDFEWMGAQRQLKVLGIFARLAHRDGKHGYIDDMPRVMAYLTGVCGRYRELAPLAGLLEALA